MLLQDNHKRQVACVAQGLDCLLTSAGGGGGNAVAGIGKKCGKMREKMRQKMR